jgi:hypothetical protein
MILALPLSPDVKKINPNGVAALAKDVTYLSEFVDGLDNAMILKENLDELQQTVLLMQTEDPNEYYDNVVRNRKFGRVDPLNGPRILEKYVFSCFLLPLLFGDMESESFKLLGESGCSAFAHHSKSFKVPSD